MQESGHAWDYSHQHSLQLHGYVYSRICQQNVQWCLTFEPCEAIQIMRIYGWLWIIILPDCFDYYKQCTWATNWTLYLMNFNKRGKLQVNFCEWEGGSMTILASSYKDVCSHGSQVHEHCSFSCAKTCLCQWSVSGQSVVGVSIHLCHSHNWDHKHMESFCHQSSSQVQTLDWVTVKME